MVNFFWSPPPTKRRAKSPRKIRGKFGAKFGAKFGTKIRRKIREIFCDFPDLTRGDTTEREGFAEAGLRLVASCSDHLEHVGCCKQAKARSNDEDALRSSLWNQGLLQQRACLRQTADRLQLAWLQTSKWRPRVPLDRKSSRKGLCRNPRGIFPNKVPGGFCGGFFSGFFWAFFLGKNRRKKSTKKSTAKFKSEFGSFAGKIHTARIRP